MNKNQLQIFIEMVLLKYNLELNQDEAESMYFSNEYRDIEKTIYSGVD